MEQYYDIISIIALTMGVSWASGINLYAAMFTLGMLGATGEATLPQGLEILSNPMVLMASGGMFAVEFFADKIPGVDTGWDAIHTFIRIPAGAILAYSAAGEVGPAAEMAAAIMGGGLAAGSHFTKAGTRAMINTSPEPVTNWTASISEDIAVIGGLWVALNHPVLFLIFMLVVILLMIWLLPKILRAIKALARKIADLFRGRQDQPAAANTSPEALSARFQDNNRD